MITCIRVIVECIVDDAFPGWAECWLIDANGLRHTFKEKLPVVLGDYSEKQKFPCEGKIRGHLIGEKHGLQTIDTLLPDGVRSTEGCHQFMVEAARCN